MKSCNGCINFLTYKRPNVLCSIYHIRPTSVFQFVFIRIHVHTYVLKLICIKCSTIFLLPSFVHNLLGRRHGVTNLQLPPSLLHFAVLIVKMADSLSA